MRYGFIKKQKMFFSFYILITFCEMIAVQFFASTCNLIRIRNCKDHEFLIQMKKIIPQPMDEYLSSSESWKCWQGDCQMGSFGTQKRNSVCGTQNFKLNEIKAPPFQPFNVTEEKKNIEPLKKRSRIKNWSFCCSQNNGYCTTLGSM